MYFDINPQRIVIQLAISSRFALRLTHRYHLWVTDDVSNTTSIDIIYKYHLKYTKNNKRFSQEVLTRYNCPNCTSFHTIGLLGKYNFILYTITASKNYNTSYISGSFSDNFYNSDGKDCNCVPLILQKNNKLKLK